MSSVGLTSPVAEARLVEFGPNEVVIAASIPTYRRVLTQLRDPLVLVLLAACLLTLATGDLPDAAVIALVIVFNTSVGVAQEARADKAMTALERLTTPHVRVVRDGRETALSSTLLVPGDVVLLAEGDIVPADGVLLEEHALLIDESTMTGESVAVSKRAPHAEFAGDEVMSGTVIVKGRCVAEIVRTGSASSLGRTAALMSERATTTPLQRRLAGLGRTLAIIVIILCAVVFARGLLRGEPLELMLITGISLAVAAIPESLPAVVTLSLALGARRMADRKAIVRRLPAVETLGSVTVLATDKTGTLTQGRMQVSEVWLPGLPQPMSLETLPDPTLTSEADMARIATMLTAAALCNDAELDSGKEGVHGLGDPTDVALAHSALTFGLDVDAVRHRFRRRAEVPFESSTQVMTTVHDDAARGEGFLVVTKGSPEAVARELFPGALATQADTMLAMAEAMARRGLRVIALSSASADEVPATPRADTLLGLAGLFDPPRTSAAATIAACRQAGITPVLITGDHPATARAIALNVGILSDADNLDAAVALGADVSRLSDEDLLRPRVFARATPEQKVAIVTAWRMDGAVVAMTGDGVNDGPALRRADIGVAMGHRGTEVARQASDLVLADDELGTLVHAVEEGRRVYANIRRFLVFGLAGGAAEIALMLIGPTVGLVVPLVASQILWINLLTHGLTGVAMGAEPGDPTAMQLPPRPAKESVLGAGVWQRISWVALLLTALTVAIGVLGRSQGWAWQTLVFLALTAGQLGVALGLRARVFSGANPWLPLSVVASLLLALAGVYLPWLQELLSTESLALHEVLIALTVGVVMLLAVRLEGKVRRTTTPSS